MRVLPLLVSVAALLALGGADRCRRECARRFSSSRLDSQEVRINRLTAQIQQLEDELEERLSGHGNDHNVLAALEARLDSVEGSGCGKGQFQCGGQCIDDLLVCDGESDCRNGHDEDESICNNLASAGTVFRGVPVGEDACTTRQPYELDIVITDTTRNDWYPSRVNVEASIITRSRDRSSTSTANLPTTGYFCFATRQLILFPPESDRLGMIVEFNTGNDDVVNGYVTRESSLERCALFVFRRD